MLELFENIAACANHKYSKLTLHYNLIDLNAVYVLRILITVFKFVMNSCFKISSELDSK